MMFEIGALRFLTYGAEAAWGDGFVGAGVCIPTAEMDIHEMFDKNRPSWFTNEAKRDLEFMRRRWTEGSLNAPLYPGYAQDFLDWGLERDTVDNGFDLLNSWGLKEVDLNGARQFKGCKVNRMVISGSSDEPEIMISTDVIGKETEDISGFARPALPTGLPYLFNASSVDWFGGALPCRVLSFEITVENNLQLAEGPLDENYRMCHLIGGFEYVSANLVIIYDDITTRTYLRNQTEGSFSITLTNGATSPLSQLTLTIPRFTLDEIPEDLDPESVTGENLSITAVADASGNQLTYAFS